MRSYTYTRGHPRMCVPTRLRTHARAHRRRRRAQRRRRAASTTRPRLSRRGGTARGRRGGAYPGQRGDRGGVPRTDVRVERRRREECLRAEATRGRRRRNALACVGADARAPDRMCTHARTDAARGRVCAAGPHRRSVHRCAGRAWI